MNVHSAAVAVIGLGLTTPATAAAPTGDSGWLPGYFTGNVAFTSDYLVHGLSQSNNGPAVQGGLDWDTGAGFHFGAWGSSLNFKDGGEATTEIDLSGGYAGALGEVLSYDAGLVYYWYPGAAGVLSYDFWEVYGKASHDFGRAAVNLRVGYSPDVFGGTGPATYVSGSLTFPVTDKISLSAGAGRSFLAQSNVTPAFLPDYWDWNAGARMSVNNWFDVDVRYHDTNVAGDCPAPGGKRWCGSKIVAAVSRSF